MNLVLFQYFGGTFYENVFPASFSTNWKLSTIGPNRTTRFNPLKDCTGDGVKYTSSALIYSAFQTQTTDTQAPVTSAFCSFKKRILDVHVHNMFFKEFCLKKNKKGLNGLKNVSDNSVLKTENDNHQIKAAISEKTWIAVIYGVRMKWIIQ